MTQKVHAGYLAEVANVRRDLWSTLAGCRVHHAQHGVGALLRNEGAEANVLVRFGKTCIAIGIRALYNGQTSIELTDKLLRLLSKDLAAVNTGKVDRFHIDHLRAKGQLIAREERKRKKSGKNTANARVIGRKPKATKKKNKTKAKPRYQDIMTRGKRLPGSYGTGKRR